MKTDYAKLQQQSQSIIEGRAYINRLSLAEEQGRTKAGRTNVEASLLCRANETANTEKPRNAKRELQEAALEDYAKHCHLWLNDIEVSALDEGAEAIVIPSNKQGYIRKLINYKIHSTTPAEFLDNRISLYNYLFPETAYELIGFTKSNAFIMPDTFAFVVEQPFVQGRFIDFNHEASALKEEANKRGFAFKVENFKPLFVNDDYIIQDLHEKNILIDKNRNLHFIDAVISLNTKDSRYNGIRTYGNGKVKNR